MSKGKRPRQKPRKPPAECLSDRERNAIGEIVSRSPDLAGPSFKPDGDGSMAPDEPTESDLVFKARVAYATGTSSPDLSARLIRQAGQVSVAPGDDVVSVTNATTAALAGIKPTTELEGLLAAQIVGTHNVAMELLRRAVASKYQDGLKLSANLASKFLRLSIDQVDALCRLQGKGRSHTSNVGSVNVEAGGQAVVGVVDTGGRNEKK